MCRAALGTGHLGPLTKHRPPPPPCPQGRAPVLTTMLLAGICYALSWHSRGGGEGWRRGRVQGVGLCLAGNASVTSTLQGTPCPNPFTSPLCLCRKGRPCSAPGSPQSEGIMGPPQAGTENWIPELPQSGREWWVWGKGHLFILPPLNIPLSALFPPPAKPPAPS